MAITSKQLQALALDVSKLAAELIKLAVRPLKPYAPSNVKALRKRANAPANEALRLQGLDHTKIDAADAAAAKAAVAAALAAIAEINSSPANDLTVSGVNALLDAALEACKVLQ